MHTMSSDTVYQIFLDLKKAYDSIDQRRVLNLMKHYKVGPNLRRYINTIWEDQQFILKQGGFFSTPIDVGRGCTQGDTNSPIIFNLIIDAVIRTWKTDLEFAESRACFYADDGLLEHTDPSKLQIDLDRIISLFAKVGLIANDKKTKFMIVRGAAAPKALNHETYNRRWRKGTARTKLGMGAYDTWRRKNISCDICGKIVTNGAIKRHMETQHNIVSQKYVCRDTQERGTYKINFVKNKFNKCPITGCTGGGKDKFGMYRHFCGRHPEADIEIMEDGILPKCLHCGMRTSNLERHEKSSTCRKARNRRIHERKQDKQHQANNIHFTVNNKKIDRVKHFKYLGRTLSHNDDDTPCIKERLKGARRQWGCIARILKREGANSVCMARFYMAVVQAVLLYGADTWVVSDRNMDRLRSFHMRAARYMTGEHIRKVGETWEYPDHKKLLLKCKLLPIETYIERRRGTLRRYIEDNRADLLEEAKTMGRHSRDVNKLLWWGQKYLDRTELKEMEKEWFK